GADGELTALVRHCLEPDLSKRLRHAGEVAAAVTAYLQSVQARLKQAEVERAAAEARAEEEQKRREVEQAHARAERKRRRMQLWLGAAVALLLLGVSAAGLWYRGEQIRLAERQEYLDREVRVALDEGQ